MVVLLPLALLMAPAVQISPHEALVAVWWADAQPSAVHVYDTRTARLIASVALPPDSRWVGWQDARSLLIQQSAGADEQRAGVVLALDGKPVSRTVLPLGDERAGTETTHPPATVETMEGLTYVTTEEHQYTSLPDTLLVLLEGASEPVFAVVQYCVNSDQDVKTVTVLRQPPDAAQQLAVSPQYWGALQKAQQDGLAEMMKVIARGGAGSDQGEGLTGGTSEMGRELAPALGHVNAKGAQGATSAPLSSDELRAAAEAAWTKGYEESLKASMNAGPAPPGNLVRIESHTSPPKVSVSASILRWNASGAPPALILNWEGSTLPRRIFLSPDQRLMCINTQGLGFPADPAANESMQGFQVWRPGETPRGTLLRAVDEGEALGWLGGAQLLWARHAPLDAGIGADLSVLPGVGGWPGAKPTTPYAVLDVATGSAVGAWNGEGLTTTAAAGAMTAPEARAIIGCGPNAELVRVAWEPATATQILPAGQWQSLLALSFSGDLAVVQRADGGLSLVRDGEAVAIEPPGQTAQAPAH